MWWGSIQQQPPCSAKEKLMESLKFRRICWQGTMNVVSKLCPNGVIFLKMNLTSGATGNLMEEPRLLGIIFRRPCMYQPIPKLIFIYLDQSFGLTDQQPDTPIPWVLLLSLAQRISLVSLDSPFISKWQCQWVRSKLSLQPYNQSELFTLSFPSHSRQTSAMFVWRGNPGDSKPLHYWKNM